MPARGQVVNASGEKCKTRHKSPMTTSPIVRLLTASVQILRKFQQVFTSPPSEDDKDELGIRPGLFGIVVGAGRDDPSLSQRGRGNKAAGQETHLQIEANLKAIEEARKTTEEVRSRVARTETEVQSLKEKLTRGVAEEIELESRELKRNPTRHKLEDTETGSHD